MSWIAFLIVGIVAGWLAGKILKGSGFGLLGNIVVGIIGSIVGRFGVFFHWNYGTINLIFK